MIGGAIGLAIGLVVTWPSNTSVALRLRQAVARLRPLGLRTEAFRVAACALPAALVTRWPVAGVTAWMAARRIEESTARRRQAQARRERKLAVAAWAQTLRDMYLAGHGIEEALARAAAVAPPVLRPLLMEAEARREHAGPAIALERLGAALDDRDADLVVLNLARAADGRAHNLPEVLGLLAASIRRTVAMEEEVDAAQAKPRRAVVLAAAIFAVLALYLVLFAPELAGYYNSLTGQLVLAGLVVWMFAGIRVLERLARPAEPDRILGTAASVRSPSRSGTALARVAAVAGGIGLLAVLARASVEFVGWATGQGTVGAAAVIALLGVAALALKDALYPAPPPLRAALAGLEVARGAGTTRPLDGAERTVRRLGDALGLPQRLEAKYATDLRIVGVTLEEHLARRFIGFAVGVFALPLVALMAYASGASTPFAVPVWVSPLLGVMGFMQPGRALGARAAARRESLRYALISFLYAAASAMKSGLGREEAVEEAANSGDGWAFAELRAAHWDAWALSEDVAEHFDRLGRELWSEELRGIAASLAAGGESGARIADALVAKAQSMQDAMLSATRSKSAKSSEDMDVALVLMVMMPVVAFLAIPAVSGVKGL